MNPTKLPEEYWSRRNKWIEFKTAQGAPLLREWLRRLAAAKAYEGSMSQQIHASFVRSA